MNIKHSQSFGIGLLALIAMTSYAFADVAGDMALAEKFLNREDVTEAAKMYRKAAEQNYLPAQVALGGLMHTTQEFDEAFGWFMMAAYQGDAAAAYNLGQMYLVGEGAEKNLVKALYWIKTSADKNYLPGVKIMALAYQSGDLGLKVDLEQAKKWEATMTALGSAEKKVVKTELKAARTATRAAYEAAEKDAAATKEASEKAADESAEKKVDEADEAAATKAADKSEPVKAK